MKKIVLLYGILGGALVALLKVVEYRFLVVEHSFEIYGGIVAAVFAGLGIWLGLKLTKTRETLEVKEVPVEVAVIRAGPFTVDAARQAKLGITARELEILALIAEGLSNKEIADRLFVSENTVKTHSARVFQKLQAKRRTQVVQRAKEAGLVP